MLLPFDWAFSSKDIRRIVQRQTGLALWLQGGFGSWWTFILGRFQLGFAYNIV